MGRVVAGVPVGDAHQLVRVGTVVEDATDRRRDPVASHRTVGVGSSGEVGGQPGQGVGHAEVESGVEGVVVCPGSVDERPLLDTGEVLRRRWFSVIQNLPFLSSSATARLDEPGVPSATAIELTSVPVAVSWSR
jgi:hypothetical protein